MRQLGYLGPDAQDALPHLIQIFYEEENQKVRRHAEEALWKIGPGGSTNTLADSMSRRTELLEMIKAPEAYTRFYAAFALGYHRPVADKKPIVQALIAATSDQDRLVRWIAVKGIGRLGPLAAEAVPVLIKFLEAENEAMRVQATIALGQIGPNAAEAVPALLKQLYVADYDLYLLSALSLARIGPVILPLLERDIKTHPFHVLQVLSYRGPDAVPLLMEALQMENKDVRIKAMEIIQWRSDAAGPAVPLLVNALRDKDTKTRQTAANALKNLGPVAKDAVPALIVTLTDKDWLVRCKAAEGLGAIGPAAKAAIPKLVQMMNTATKSRDEVSQSCAAKGLMKMAAEARALVPAAMIKQIEERDQRV